MRGLDAAVVPRSPRICGSRSAAPPARNPAPAVPSPLPLSLRERGSRDRRRDCQSVCGWSLTSLASVKASPRRAERQRPNPSPEGRGAGERGLGTAVDPRSPRNCGSQSAAPPARNPAPAVPSPLPLSLRERDSRNHLRRLSAHEPHDPIDHLDELGIVELSHDEVFQRLGIVGDEFRKGGPAGVSLRTRIKRD